MRHLTDLSLILFTFGDIRAAPTFFHTSLSFFNNDLWMMDCIYLVFFGFIHMLTSSWEKITGMRLCTWASSGVASFVRITISLFSEYNPATRKWSPSFGLRQKGSFFWFHSKYPYIMTTHLFWIISTNILLLNSSSILPLMTILYLLWWPHFIKVSSFESSSTFISSWSPSFGSYE